MKPVIKLPGTYDPAKRLSGWWGVALFVLLVAQCFLFSKLTSCGVPKVFMGWISLDSGDRPSYTGAMDNLINEGRYYFTNMMGGTTLAGRMPHYAVPYLLLRLVTPHAADICVLGQIALLAFAVWALADLLVRMTGARWTGLAFLFIGGVCGHLSPWTLITTPDAPGYALLALAMHRFWLTELRDEKRDRWWLAVLMGLLIVIKPYYALLMPLIVLRWLYRTRDLATTFRLGLVLATPVLLLLAPWWVRNAVVMGRFFPFQQDMQAGYGYSSTDLRSWSFGSAVGENGMVWWDPHSLASALRLDAWPATQYQWPAYLSPELLQGFKEVQRTYKDFQRDRSDRNAAIAERTMDSVEVAYKQRYPWRYHVVNRFTMVPVLVLSSGSGQLPVYPSNPCFSPWQWGLKGAASLAYFISLLGLFIGVLILPFRRGTGYWMWLVPAVYLIVLFGMVLRHPEWRYFDGAFLPNVWVAVLLAHSAWHRLMQRRRRALP